MLVSLIDEHISESGEKIQLWAGSKGYDIVTVLNGKVIHTCFIENKAEAERLFEDYLYHIGVYNAMTSNSINKTFECKDGCLVNLTMTKGVYIVTVIKNKIVFSTTKTSIYKDALRIYRDKIETHQFHQAL